MPVEIIGWVAPHISSEMIIASGPHFDLNVIKKTAQVHENGNFDRVLVGYFSDAPDGAMIVAHAASVTTKLQFLLAHRPGFVVPTVAARAFATLDQLSLGRLAVHIIAGGSDADQAKDGDYSTHADRYLRCTEYIKLMRLTWTRKEPFDFKGQFYKTNGTQSHIQCFQRPHIPVYGREDRMPPLIR